jgi:hypothetical protein
VETMFGLQMMSESKSTCAAQCVALGVLDGLCTLQSTSARLGAGSHLDAFVISFTTIRCGAVCVCVTEIGVGLTGFGVLFLFMGVMFMFDTSLLILGNVRLDRCE